MKRMLLLLPVICITIIVDAIPVKLQSPIIPVIWHQIEAKTVSISYIDTIAIPTDYAMMVVYKSVQPDSAQQLWRISRADSIYYSISTHGMATEKSEAIFEPRKDISKPHIYSLQHTIKKDTAYHGIYQLCIGSNDTSVSSDIVMYEAAYFDRSLSQKQSLMFQTYLALKYGITLDMAHYISPAGDTLWNAKRDRIYYHNIKGIGRDSVYDWFSLSSRSFEDSLLIISYNDTIPINTYAIVGDDDGLLDWYSFQNNLAILHRKWRLYITDTLPYVNIMLNKKLLPDVADAPRMVILDEDENIISSVFADSIVGEDYLSYRYNRPYRVTYFSFITDNLQELPLRRNSQRHSYTEGSDDGSLDIKISVSPNPTSGKYTLDISLPEKTDICLLIHTSTGKIADSIKLSGACAYKYKGEMPSAGLYLITIISSDGETLATKELIVY
ncbi:MAG: hypothetical protein IJ650_01900 [Paludibacteraceae bacterium]|nr:hypothetical protein [Paludibacteraceae bacterium]